MGRIELAYSLELNRVMDALEANELWLEGKLKDKRNFECIDQNCHAGITCRNMDTYINNRKMLPNFIMSSRENNHDINCQIYKEYEEQFKKNNKQKKGEKAKTIGKRACFHMIRPENHKLIQHIDNSNGILSTKNKKEKIEKKYISSENRKSNYYWLYSIITYYLNSYKNGTLHDDKLEIDFGNGKIYNYSLDKLFKRIKTENEFTDTDKKHYVYCGKGKIFGRKDGGYDLVFDDKFVNSSKKVKCIINKNMIEQCTIGRINKIHIFEQMKEKESFIYVLGTKNISDKYNTVYLNICSLDNVAISEIDLDEDD